MATSLRDHVIHFLSCWLPVPQISCRLIEKLGRNIRSLKFKALTEVAVRMAKVTLISDLHREYSFMIAIPDLALEGTGDFH